MALKIIETMRKWADASVYATEEARNEARGWADVIEKTWVTKAPSETEPCDECDGVGHIDEDRAVGPHDQLVGAPWPCTECDGTGRVMEAVNK
jgi:DnaJ-class molecular chaperone